VRVRLNLKHGWRLAGGELSSAEAALAIEELQRALGPPGASGVELALAHGDGRADGFRRRAAPHRVEVHGESPRGLLFAVYAMLEELGESWPWPGEHRGRRGEPWLEDWVEDRPALPGRCLVLGERALVEHADDWIVWASRRRLNCLFVHVSTRREALGAAPEATWRKRRERAIELARERGITLEHGGHLLPELVSEIDIRALAEARPVDAAARRALEDHIRAHPEAEILHLWGADAPDSIGAGRAASEAALRATNAVAEIAAAARPGTQVAFLAYHDTLEVPRAIRPRSNVCLLFAPRERCYEHALSAADCPTNARHREALEAQIEHFAAAGAAPARVFEYWFDAIRFAGGIPDLTETMADDLAYYQRAGVHAVQMLITGHGRVPGPHPNPAAFARLAWDPGAVIA
jgi:Domain of unknown function (DUF4838)